MIQITSDPIDATRAWNSIDPQNAGSVVLHLAVVKADAQGKKSRGILFKDKGGLAAELEGIEKDLRANYDLTAVLLIRRLGELAVGDAIALAAVAAPGREDAFAACREAVERFRKMKSIDKTERIDD